MNVQRSAGDQPSDPIGYAELELALHSADPSALLVHPRILRRVIKQDARIRGFGLRVPHRKTYVIRREELLGIADLEELDLPPATELPETVILIARPPLEKLQRLPGEEALAKHWRLLFHARVHIALDQIVAEGRLGPAVLRQRISQIGETEFAAIRGVLRQEDFLLPPKNELTVYCEFAAVYLELRHFAGNFLSSYFPSLEDLSAVDDVLRQDVDADALYYATRLPGAADRSWRSDVSTAEPSLPRPQSPAATESRRSQRLYRKLASKAERVGALGNFVRAAILRTRAARFATLEVARIARADARADLDRLSRRLQSALGFSATEADDWSKALVALLEQAARGIWSPEARLLYDLQKVCVDHERGVYALDAFGWIKSLGRRAMRRNLPGQRDVLISKHLRIAEHRLSAARISGRARSRLSSLLKSAVHRAEGMLRARFRPPLEAALDAVKLTPKNLPERVARKKFVDELLDRVVDRGFLTMGDLRDGLSRNNLKLPDLTNAGQIVHGDELLLADRHLAETMDGVYRRGEVYLRWPQRFSSLAFGTPVGRFLTRYVALPFGGAFVALEGLQHLVKLSAEHLDTPYVHLRTKTSVLLLGLLLFGLLHQQAFRTLLLEVMWTLGRALRLLLVELPKSILRWPIVRWIIDSAYFKAVVRYVVKPLAISAVLSLGMSLAVRWQTTLESGIFLFLIVNVLLNSRIGRNFDEMVTDWTVHAWHRLRFHVLAALFRFTMDAFNGLLESLERLLYAVDEWLRFRSGENALITGIKAVLGTIWAVVHYVIRIYVNLLIEPQVNPIKHFPVVTVSHKFMIFFLQPLTEILATPLMPLGSGLAYTVAGTTVLLLPGVFGFLVWELKENWRLYAANRPKNLQPVIVGHHGETMVQFMRPGFRSGTLPKLYARLRRSNRKAYWTANWKRSGKYLESLHHVEEHVRRFVDREFLTLLQESKGWDAGRITTGEIHLGTNRILIELYCPELSEDSLWIALEEHSGWLLAATHQRGWVDYLTPKSLHTLGNAMAGFYKLSGVDLVREQIEAKRPPAAGGYEINEDGLVLLDRQGRERKMVALRDWPPPQRQLRDPFTSKPIDADRAQLVFAGTPISWRRWVIIWEMDQIDASARQRIMTEFVLLPRAAG